MSIEMTRTQHERLDKIELIKNGENKKHTERKCTTGLVVKWITALNFELT